MRVVGHLAFPKLPNHLSGERTKNIRGELKVRQILRIHIQDTTRKYK